MPKRPGWLDLPEALERVSQHELQRPFDGLSRKDAKKVFRKLEELLLGGNIAARVYIENRAVPLTVDDMLSVPFGIHFEMDGTPKVEVHMRPDRLSRMIVNADDLSQAMAAIRLDRRAAEAVAPISDAGSDSLARFHEHFLGLIERKERKARPDLWKTAKTKYKIKLEAFNALWDELAAKAGWNKPGRWK